MRAQFRFWLVLSLLLVAGVIILRWKERSNLSMQGDLNAAVETSQPPKAAAPVLLTTPALLASYMAERDEQNFEPATNRARYQLSNVRDSIGALTRRESAVLMRNALIDTREAIHLPIPSHLRAGENPGAYIVQMRDTKPGAFQKMLKAAGAEVIAYVPNNAYLVKATATVAENLRGEGTVRSLLPYEPYYKIDSRLMKFAVEEKPLDDETWLRVTLFPGGTADTLRPLAREVGISEASPFGEQILIQPRVEALAELAQLAEVQIIEPWNRRMAANDLTRVRMGVADDQLTTTNYLDLRGSNIWMNLNDVGVDRDHKDLEGRVFFHGTNATTDPEGHGTHVAATMIGNGSISNVFDRLSQVITNINTNRFTFVVTDDGTTTTTNTYLDGSPTNGSMRGLAPLAKLFVLPVSVGPERNTPVTDTYLIETAARTNYVTIGRTNTLISNNSWNYANTVDYDSQAARFDAATRDALPDIASPQPVLYVFAAGNNGSGDDDGNNGEPGRITSPGTAKNVITVGALETPRFIAEALTNFTIQMQGTNTITNTNSIQIFLPATDTESEVASFSSRGNTGIGVEGDFGRFKPDLVAPGTFILSARSKQWNLTNDFNPAASENSSNYFMVMSNLNSVSTQYRYDAGTSFSAPAVSGLLGLVQEFFAQRLPGNLKRNLSPALMKALFINSAQPTHPQYDYEVQNIINYMGWGHVNIRNVLATNMLTAPEKDWHVQLVEQTPTNAVTTGEAYTWDVGFTTNSVDSSLRVTLVWTDPPGNPTVATKLVNDLDLVVQVGGTLYHGNDFLTGRRVTEPRGFEENLMLTNNPANPGPVFGDSEFRDRINNVENVYIPAGGLGGGTNIQIHVIGRRVNVKGLTEYTGGDEEIKQDFALVVSSSYRGVDANDKLLPPFTRFERKDFRWQLEFKNYGAMTNGLPLLRQRVGANSPLLTTTNGMTNQWNFYVFTNQDVNVEGFNTQKAGEYVAFVTFAPPNQALPRVSEADIDLFVSLDPRLTNLNSDVLASTNTWRSLLRGGTEQVVFAPGLGITNVETGLQVDTAPLYPAPGGVIVGQSHLGAVFYVGVKSEDQQAAEFSLIAVSSDRPFEEDRNGVRVLRGIPSSAFIPDGLPNSPQAATVLAIGMSSRRILDASVFMTLSHQEYGDLFGHLRHNSTRAVLNSDSTFNQTLPGTNSFIFSDDFYLNRNVPPDSREYPAGLSTDTYQFSAGPPGLADFAGAKPDGAWILDMVDSAFSHTGRVEVVEIHLKPVEDLKLNGVTSGEVAGLGQKTYAVQIPPDGKSLTLTLKQLTGNGALQMYVRKDLVPTTNEGGFDFHVMITPPADTVTLKIDRTNNFPPLSPGTWFVTIVNPGTLPAKFEIRSLLDLDDAGANLAQIGATNIIVPDDKLTTSIAIITNDFAVAGVQVRLLAEDILESDLVLRLTSPQGTTVILSENRGHWDNNGFGATFDTFDSSGNPTNIRTYAVFTDLELGQLPIKLTPPPFGDNSPTIGLVRREGFEGATIGEKSAPTIFDGWSVTSNTVVVATGNAAHTGANFANLFFRGGMARSVPVTPGRAYKLTFAYRGQPATNSLFNTGKKDDGALLAERTFDTHYRLTQSADPGFIGSDLFVAATNSAPFPAWFPNDTNSQWIALSPVNDNNHPPGTYQIRNTFMVRDLQSHPFRVRFSASDNSALTLNGAGPGFINVIGPGAFSPWIPFNLGPGLHVLDFDITRGLPGPVGLRAEMEFLDGFTNEVRGNMRLTGGRFTNEIQVLGASDWKIASTEFIADTNAMRLEFWAGEFAGVDIDTVELIDTGTVFLQSEEPLAIFEGQRAMGEWRLDALDNSTGLSERIDEWQLLLNRAPAMLPAEALQNNRLFPNGGTNSPAVQTATYFKPGQVRGSEIHWFYYDVCADATVVNLTLFPQRTNLTTMQLLIDRSGFPTGSPTTDDYPIYSTTTTNLIQSFRLDFPAWAPLRPGTRLFFAVRNAEPFRFDEATFQFFRTTNTFAIQVRSDGACAFTAPTLLAFSQSLEYIASGANDQGDSFSLSAANAASLNVTLQDPGALTVVASSNGDPTLSNYQIKQMVTSSGTLTLPNGGNWRFRVYNEGAEAVRYTLLATSNGPVPILDTRIATNGKFQVTWQSIAGHGYEIAVSADLNSNTWNPVTTITASSAQTTYADDLPATQPKRFYRIRPLN